MAHNNHLMPLKEKLPALFEKTQILNYLVVEVPSAIIRNLMHVYRVENCGSATMNT